MQEQSITPHIQKLEKLILDSEQRFSILGAAIIIASILMFLAAIYVQPSFEATSHGIYYAKLASDPFHCKSNPNAYRILTPLISYAIGLRGNGILITNLLIAWLIIVLLYYFCRKSDNSPLLSLLQAAIITFSMPTLFTIYYGGYTDSTTYLIILLIMYMINKQKTFLVWTLFLFGLLNRESIVFLVPFFFLLAIRKRFNITANIFGVVISIGIYLVIRDFISQHIIVEHSAELYLGPLINDIFYWLRQGIYAYSVGMFSVFKIFWLIPIIAVFLCARRNNYFGVVLIISPIICSMFQSLFAVDTSRLISMSFPAILLGMDMMKDEWGNEKMQSLISVIFLVNFLVPQLYVTSNNISIMNSLPTSLVKWMLL